MTSIKPLEFDEEYERKARIGKIVVRKRYKKVFKFMVKHFNDNNNNTLSSLYLQQKMFIPERTEAFQILHSFIILGLLNKVKKDNKVRYYPVNDEYWKIAKEAVEKEEKNASGETTG